MSVLLEKAKEIADDARVTIAEIQAEVSAQKSNRDSLLKQKHDLYLQPLTKEDIKQIIFDWIDKQAQLYLERGGITGIINSLALPARRIDTSLPKPINRAVNLYEIDDGIKPDGSFQSYIFDMNSLPIFNGYAFSHGSKTDLCFFFGDVIKEKIDANFDAFFPSGWDSYQPGLPLAQRRPLIADLDAQIAVIDANIKELESHLRTLSLSAKVQG